ncbi:hypothetical protein GGR50DRAFT_646271 [Xylaria sp. CBS 124048]|nr:hypothetical protein GGR50DRAFT_646271 [Xylaria sp. CBS 124048]
MRRGTLIRLKVPVAPVRTISRRDSDSLSSLDLSDESGYSGVEDITGSDDDEEDVEAAEEEHILSDELQHTVQSSPRPNTDDEDDEIDDADDEEAIIDDEAGDYEGDDDDAEESASFDGFPSDSDSEEFEEDVTGIPAPTVQQRRVRFDVPPSDDDDTETDEDTAHRFFPDLFVDKSTLDPSFRQEVDQNSDSDSDSDAYWDHYETSGTLGLFEDDESDFEALVKAMQEDDTPVATPITPNDIPHGVSGSIASPERDEVSPDGYQTDGDTTDEEEPVPKPARRKSRRDLVEEASDTSDVEIIKGRRGQPRVGRFSLDKSSKKPIAMVNPNTGKLMIFTTHRGHKRGLDLSPEQFKLSFFDEVQTSPILGNPGNIMMSGMISNTFGDFMNTHAVGPAEAWYAQVSETNTFCDSSSSEDPTVDEEEKGLKMEDFLEFDDDSDLSDEQQEMDKDDGDDIMCTPSRPTTASSDLTSLLDHFEHDSNLVGAFRRDQAHHRLITRNKATHDSLAFSGPYFEGTLRGIKDGRIATANVPISPLRRRKKMPEFASSPLSGSTKRKASSDHRTGHKKQRSVPDVGPLHL